MSILGGLTFRQCPPNSPWQILEWLFLSQPCPISGFWCWPFGPCPWQSFWWPREGGPSSGGHHRLSRTRPCPTLSQLCTTCKTLLGLSWHFPSEHLKKNQKNNELISHCGFQIHAWSKYLISLRQRQERYQETIKRLATWNFWMKYTGKTISENKAKKPCWSGFKRDFCPVQCTN